MSAISMTGGISQFARVLDSIPLVTVQPVDTLPPEIYHAPEAEWQAAMTAKYGAVWEMIDD